MELCQIYHHWESLCTGCDWVWDLRYKWWITWVRRQCRLGWIPYSPPRRVFDRGQYRLYLDGRGHHQSLSAHEDDLCSSPEHPAYSSFTSPLIALVDCAANADMYVFNRTLTNAQAMCWSLGGTLIKILDSSTYQLSSFFLSSSPSSTLWLDLDRSRRSKFLTVASTSSHTLINWFRCHLPFVDQAVLSLSNNIGGCMNSRRWNAL